MQTAAALGIKRDQQPVAMTVQDLQMPGKFYSANDLCDALMGHIFECEHCINGHESSCEVFADLRERITEAGGPTRGLMLTM